MNAKMQFKLIFINLNFKINLTKPLINGHKYLVQRSKANELKLKHSEYNNNINTERPKHIHLNIIFDPALKRDFIVFSPSYSTYILSCINFNDDRIAS